MIYLIFSNINATWVVSYQINLTVQATDIQETNKKAYITFLPPVK